MSQRVGWATSSGSTSSVGMASWLVSYSRLFSRIWDGSMGRNVRKIDAPAALNMFPKLLDVPISTYLMVLAKIWRPPITPSASTSRSFSSSSTSAASLATSVAESTEIPTSAACSAIASLTPSPRKATSAPVARCARTIWALCSGLTRANTVVAASRSPSRSPALSMSAPVATCPAGRPRSAQTLAATTGLSPVRILTVTPSPASRSSAARASGFGGSRKTRRPRKARPCSSAGDSADWPGASRVATAITRLPAANSASSAARAAAGISVHRSSSPSGAPLVMTIR